MAYSVCQMPGFDKTYELIEDPLKNIDESLSKLTNACDLTRRKKHQEAIKAAEEEHRSVFEHV